MMILLLNLVKHMQNLSKNLSRSIFLQWDLRSNGNAAVEMILTSLELF